MGASGGDGGNRAGIGEMIAHGVGIGLGRFAKHVVGVGIALRFHASGAFHGAFDGFAKDELAAHFLHCTTHCGSDDRLTKAFDRPAQRANNARFVVFEHLARQHERPCRGVDKRGCGLPKMLAPVRRRDLVLDKRVDSFRVRHPQEGFGKAHERDALIRGQPIFGKENLHHARLCRRADCRNERGGTFGDILTALFGEVCLGHEFCREGLLFSVGGGVDQGAAGHGALHLFEIE